MSETALAIHGLAFRHPGAAAPLLAIDRFKLAEGEQALLTGRSGSGKSTLLHLIAGLVELAPPCSGEILVAGQPIQRLRGPARDRFRGQRIGLVFQEHHLLQAFTARENVLAALAFSGVPPKEHGRISDELLERLDIRARAHATPDRLSQGQQQRVAVARALATGPALVLADEPTASLDPDNAAAAVGLLREACRDREAALLVVSHDPALPPLFERAESLDALNSVAAGP